MNPIDMQKFLIGLVSVFGTGILTYLGLAIRRSARNAGRTELEISLDELRAAVDAERAAKETADPADDLATARCSALARARVSKARRLKAQLDALAGDVD